MPRGRPKKIKVENFKDETKIEKIFTTDINIDINIKKEPNFLTTSQIIKEG